MRAGEVPASDTIECGTDTRPAGCPRFLRGGRSRSSPRGILGGQGRRAGWTVMIGQPIGAPDRSMRASLVSSVAA